MKKGSREISRQNHRGYGIVRAGDCVGNKAGDTWSEETHFEWAAKKLQLLSSRLAEIGFYGYSEDWDRNFNSTLI